MVHFQNYWVGYVNQNKEGAHRHQTWFPDVASFPRLLQPSMKLEETCRTMTSWSADQSLAMIRGKLWLYSPFGIWNYDFHWFSLYQDVLLAHTLLLRELRFCHQWAISYCNHMFCKELFASWCLFQILWGCGFWLSTWSILINWMNNHKKLIRYCGAVMFRSPVVQLMVDLFCWKSLQSFA